MIIWCLYICTTWSEHLGLCLQRIHTTLISQPRGNRLKICLKENNSCSFFFLSLYLSLFLSLSPFLEICLFLVCMTLIIPRLTLFWLTTVYRSKNSFISLCSRQQFLLSHACWRKQSYRADVFFGCNTKKEQQIHSSVFGKFPYILLIQSSQVY